MLAQMKSVFGGPGRAELAARLGAWWEGRDYPGPLENAVSEPVAPALAPTPQPPVDAAAGFHPTQRVRAIEALWGEGRFSPGSDALDALMLDALFESSGAGGVGFLSVDPAILKAARARSDRPVHVCEWRMECAARTEALLPGVAVARGEVDRPKGLPDAGLAALLSTDAFAFADHKAGLVGKVHRALGEQGRWVLVETVRRTRKTPPEAFASAFAEPMLPSSEEIEDLLGLAGFRVTRRTAIATAEAAADRLGRLAALLEEALRAASGGRDDALFLQELNWEVRSWRARLKALQGGALSVQMWVADKGAPQPARARTDAHPPASQPVPSQPAPPAVPAAAQAAGPADGSDWALDDAGPMDQSAVDSLFD
jgi:hypothetical protein